MSALLLDTSTVDVETSRFCHEASADRGYRFVDSPVSGGIAGASAGTLTFMLGGKKSAVAKATVLVEPMAGHVFQVGGPTMGIAAKLANNLMLFVSLLGVAEGTQLAAELGLDAETFFRVASVSSGDSWPLRTWYPAPGVVATSPANRNFDASFTSVLAQKDLSFALTAGERAGLHMPAGRIALDQFERLIDEGYGLKDCSLIVKYASADGRVDGFDPDA
jgi:3-hydroxyisobutyrate dehydrogenase